MSRDPASRSARPPLELVGLAQPDPERRIGGERHAAGARRPITATEFVVRWEHRPGVSILWLSGALDRATSTLLDEQFDARAIDSARLVIDLTGIEFIDFGGVDALMRVHRRASQQEARLSFRHGPHVAQRPLELTRHVQRRSQWAARGAVISSEDSYFALAMACVDVDHPRPGDRPGAS